MDEATRSRIVLADTTPLFAAFSPNDQFHDRAQADLRRLEQERRPVAVLTTTIVETHTLILYRQGAVAATAWFDAVAPSARMIHPTMEDFRTAVPYTRRFPDQRLTVFDALVDVVSNRLSVPIWSYDHHFDVLQADRWYA